MTETAAPEITLKGLELLRQEVPDNLVGKLPKVTCSDCRKKENRGECGKHRKTTCGTCGGWLTPAHTHLDYVGHAETTSKILEADIAWNWEPLAFTAEGLPAFDADGGLWIRLTVCGVTRLGYGTADNANGFKSRGDIRKEIIGDAIRNAAMRFGWALNLWAKTDIHETVPQEESRDAAAEREAAPRQQRAQHRDRLRQRKPGDDDPWASEPPPPAAGRPTKPMLGALATLAGKKRGVGNNRDARLELMRSFLPEARRGQIRSGYDLTFDEASHIIGLLEKEPDLPPPADATPLESLPTLAQLLESATAADGVFEQLKRLIREADSDAAMERLILTALDAGKGSHISHGQYDALCEMGRLRSEAMHAEPGWSARGVAAMAGSAVSA